MNVINVLLCLYLAIQLIIVSFILQPLILLVISSIGRNLGLWKTRSSTGQTDKEIQFGIIITAHKETEFIPPIVDSLLKQTHSRFNVYVEAENCDHHHPRFSAPRIPILDPPQPFHNQLASLQYGFENLSADDEVLVIFDPDNLVHPNFLKVLNTWSNKVYGAVQGKLQPKNTEGP